MFDNKKKIQALAGHVKQITELNLIAFRILEKEVNDLKKEVDQLKEDVAGLESEVEELKEQ